MRPLKRGWELLLGLLHLTFYIINWSSGSLRWQPGDPILSLQHILLKMFKLLMLTVIPLVHLLWLLMLSSNFDIFDLVYLVLGSILGCIIYLFILFIILFFLGRIAISLGTGVSLSIAVHEV